MDRRKCSRCREYRDAETGFYNDDRPGVTRADGKRSECIECTLAPTRSEEFREHRAEYMRGYRKRAKKGKGNK